jgi:hypothetical protein
MLGIEQIQAFLEASDEVEFKAGNKEDLYDWVNQTLQQLNYRKLKRSGRGLVRRYVSKMTGLSRAQATRLLGMYLRGEKVQPKQYRRRRFPQRYTREDAALLASVDEVHDTISGPATRKILQRARYDFKDAKYTRLAELSVAQLYRLRKSRAYRERLTTYQPTRPTKVSIGERVWATREYSAASTLRQTASASWYRCLLPRTPRPTRSCACCSTWIASCAGAWRSTTSDLRPV